MSVTTQEPRTIARRLNKLGTDADLYGEGLDMLKAEWYLQDPEEFPAFMADLLLRFLPMGKPTYTTRQQRERLDVAVQHVTGLRLADFVGEYVPRRRRRGRKPR